MGIYGARGHGRDLMLFLPSLLGDEYEFVMIDDDHGFKNDWNLPVMSLEKFVALESQEKKLAIAVAGGQIRKTLVERVSKHGIEPITAIADNCLIAEDASVGEGTLISPFCVISSNVRIGKYGQINTMTSVAHDCCMGDFVTLSPGVKCNGCVEIDDFAFIGSGALIKQGSLEKRRKIGKGAIVGIGAVVLTDIPPGETWAGNPARRIR